MARLPGVLDIGDPRGARPSGASVRPTDFALGDLGEAVAQAGQAYLAVADQKAERALLPAQAGYEGEAAQRSAAYDGREPGYANAETAHFDAYFKPITEDPKLSDVQRFALRKRLDVYRQQAGARAVGVEAEKRGGVVAEHRAAMSAQNLSDGMSAFQDLYHKGMKDLSDSYDGSTQDYTRRAGQVADDAMAMALETVPDADHDTFKARVAGVKTNLQGQAQAVEDQRQQAYVVDKVKSAQGRNISTIIGNPDAFSLASSLADEVVAGVPKALRAPMLKEYQGSLAAARVQGLIVKGDLTTAGHELAAGQYDDVLEPGQKLQLIEAVRSHSAKRASDLIESLSVGVDVDRAALAQAAKDSGDAGLMAKASMADQVLDAQSAALGEIGAGGTRKGFAEAADFVIQLEGGDATIQNDNGRGVSRFGINQSANPDVDVPNLTRSGAVKRYQRYWTDVGASRLPPGLAIAAFDAAVLMGPEKARGFIAEGQGDLGQFFALEQAEMQRLAKADPAKYGDDLKGWLNRVEKVKAEAARRQGFANVQQGLADDPIKFALGGDNRAPLAAVPPLPEELAGPAFQAALQGREQVGRFMANQYHAPFRLLTDADASRLRDEIARNPRAALSLVENAVAAVGPQGARAMLTEIGKQGEADLNLHLADLAAGGSHEYATLAVDGLALKAQGSELDVDKKAAVKAAMSAVVGGLQGLNVTQGMARQTAEAAMLADPNGRSAAWHVQAALGAKAVGQRVYGGVIDVNGRPTVLPPWLAQDHADDMMDTLAADWSATKAGPRHSDGTPYPENALRHARLVLMPDGNYRLLDKDGTLMLGKDPSRPFELDLDASKLRMRAAFGVKGGVLP